MNNTPLVEQLTIRIPDGRIKCLNILRHPFLRYEKNIKNGEKTKKIVIPWLQSKSQDVGQMTFYLKVNTDSQYAILCLQQWLELIRQIGGRCYIICDRAELRKRISEEVLFYDQNVQFLYSINKKNVCLDDMVSPRWYNAALAHLTTFYHAHRHNIKNFWNIDADDTMFVAPIGKIVNILKEAVAYSDINNLDIFSLDMWASRTRGVHWSFGVSYVRNVDVFLRCFQSIDSTWKAKYADKDYTLNIDWFVTYLKDENYVKAGSFYIEKCYFIHWCRNSFIREIFLSYICYWENNELHYPIISDVFLKRDWGIIPVAKDCIKLDVGLDKQECIDLLVKKVSNIMVTPRLCRKLWHIN